MASKQSRFTDREIMTRWGAAYSFGKRKYEDLKIVFALASQPELWAWMQT